MVVSIVWLRRHGLTLVAGADVIATGDTYLDTSTMVPVRSLLKLETARSQRTTGTDGRSILLLQQATEWPNPDASRFGG